MPSAIAGGRLRGEGLLPAVGGIQLDRLATRATLASWLGELGAAWPRPLGSVGGAAAGAAAGAASGAAVLTAG